MKIVQVGTQLSHVDGQTDKHDEANSRFSQFYERAWKSQYMEIYREEGINSYNAVLKVLCKRTCNYVTVIRMWNSFLLRKLVNEID